jgi:hypothetical protein
MYARVASFEGDMSQVDDLVGTIRERMSSGASLPGATRFLMLLDRENGTSLGITLFESEEAIRVAEPTFERMAQEIPEVMRGRRTSLEIYEVAIDDVAGGARAARVSTLEGATERIDEGIRFVKEQIAPEASDLTGWRGIVALVDRADGRTKTITFWDSPESLRASEERADELRAQAAEAMDEAVVAVDRYEVALHEAPVTA